MGALAWTADDYDTLVALARAQVPPIDPSAVAIVLWEESGMDPANPGPAHANPPVGGLNQMSTTNLGNMGITRDAWLAMTPSQQLPHVFQWWKSIARTFNAGRFPADEGQLLGLNFLPGAYLRVGASADSEAVIAGRAGPYAWAFNDNPALAAGGDVITVASMRRYLSNVAIHAGAAWTRVLGQIQAAIVRFEQGTPTPPDGRGGSIVALLLVTGAAVWFATKRA